jgi:hypothetical protein
MGTVVDPSPARLDELAGGDHRGVAENRDQITLPAGFDAVSSVGLLMMRNGMSPRVGPSSVPFRDW